MSLDANKALVQRLYDELFNRGRLRSADTLIAGDFIRHGAPPGTPSGPDGVRHALTMLRAACPDGRFVIEELIAEGDLVAARLTFSGLAPTGQPLVQEQIHILRIAGGLGVEQWTGAADQVPHAVPFGRGEQGVGDIPADHVDQCAAGR